MQPGKEQVMASSDSTTGAFPSLLAPSALGSKEHWDAAYDRELENYSGNPEDEGTIWFENTGAEDKMIAYLEKLKLSTSDDDGLPNSQNPALRILDLGTGNGHLLFSLRDEGWQGELVGIDYSEKSIKLAESIQEGRLKAAGDDGADQGDASVSKWRRVEFELWDILADAPSQGLQRRFDIVLDKGTFDAISLNNSDTYADGMTGCQIYGQRVAPLLKPEGYLLITTCNWTAVELRKWLETPQLGLLYFGSVPYRSFTFGGVQGQAVSTLCFKRTTP